MMFMMCRSGRYSICSVTAGSAVVEVTRPDSRLPAGAPWDADYSCYQLQRSSLCTYDAVCAWEQVYLAGVQELGVDMLPSEQQRRTPPGSSLG